MSNEIFNQRKTWKEKSKNNFKWAEECADYIDRLYSPYQDKKRLTRLQMNYNLYNGLGEKAMEDYALGNKDILAEEGFEMDYQKVQHHPVIDQVAKAMVGEQQLRPFNPVAFDVSKYSMNTRKRKKLELLQQYLDEKIIQPIVQQTTQEWMIRNEVTDPYKLNPQQQNQMQNEINQMVEIKTPSEIKEYMRKDYKSPEEIQAQKIMDFLNSYLELKFITDKGFEQGVITGEEIYRVGIRHNRPFVDLVNPLGFYYTSRPNSIFIEDGVTWKYEQYVMLNDIYNWHGDEIKNSKKLKDKLDRFIETNHDTWGAGPVIFEQEVASGNVAIVDASPDIRSQEGQEYIRNILATGYHGVNRGGDVRYSHTAWKGLRKLKQIKRYNPDEDNIKSIWQDESYRFNPLQDRDGYKDIEEHVVWVPELWQTTVVDYDIYFQKEPIPYQNLSLDNPWDIKGPYIGAEYNRLMGNSSNVAPMDLGKPWQYKFNVQMAKIHELEATDMGKVIMASFNAKPQGWSWKKYLMMAKYGKILPVDLNQEGVNPAIDSTVFKQLDMSTIQDIAAKLQYLEFIKQQISLSMGYNPSRMGLQSPVVSVTNNQQNIVQSSYLTNNIYNLHNKIVENLCNALVNVSRVALRDSDIKSYILDDMSIAELEIDDQMLDRSEIMVKLRNSSEDFQNIIQLKQLMQPLVQNGLVSLPELIRLQWSKSGAEIQNIAETAEERMNQQRQDAQEEQQMLIQQQADIQRELENQKQEFELLKQRLEHENNKEVEVISSTRYAQEQDINKNQIDDDYEIELLKQQLEKEKLELEKEKFKVETELKRLELKIKGKGNKE